MLHIFTGPAQLDSYRRAIGATGACALSPRAAAVVLHCSPEHVRYLVSHDELEAWAYHTEEGALAEHYRVLIP